VTDPYWGDEVSCRDGNCEVCGIWETVATVNSKTICPYCDIEFNKNKDLTK
jgi:hypothetical protein